MLELFLPLSPLAFVRHSSELHALLRSCGAARNETTLGEVVGSGENFSVYHMIAAKAAEQMFNKYRKKEEEAIQQPNCLEFLKNYVHYDPEKKKEKKRMRKERKRYLSLFIILNLIEILKSQSSACFITLSRSIMYQSSKNF